MHHRFGVRGAESSRALGVSILECSERLAVQLTRDLMPPLVAATDLEHRYGAGVGGLDAMATRLVRVASDRAKLCVRLAAAAVDERRDSKNCGPRPKGADGQHQKGRRAAGHRQ